jgi:predicted dehydrogenase
MSERNTRPGARGGGKGERRQAGDAPPPPQADAPATPEPDANDRAADEPVDAPRPVDRLRAVVIGLGGVGELTLQSLLDDDGVDVVGVGDKDARVGKAFGERFSLPHYTDNRQLLVKERPAVAFLSVPPMVRPELVWACAERGVHVWMESPLGRSVEEALAMVRRMEKAGLKLSVGTQWRFAPGYRCAKEYVSELGEVFLARAHYLFNWGPRLSWRGDRESAGGGAMIDLGYHPVDLLQWVMGVPEEVYGAVAFGHRATELPDGEVLPVYDTDDTAAVVLRYVSGSMATVVTTRASGPISEEVTLHGRKGSLRATSENCTVRDADGNVIDHLAGEPAPREAFARQARAFVEAVRTGAEFYEASARENLLNLATIEAVYLSARTGEPERPLKMLENAGLRVADCLVHVRPPAEQLPDWDDLPPAGDED